MPAHTYGWDATGNRLQAGGAAGTDAYHHASDSDPETGNIKNVSYPRKPDACH